MRARGASLLICVMFVCLAGCQFSNALWRRQGHDAVRAKDLQTAEDRFGRAVARNPTDWRAHFHLGLIHLEQDRATEAEQSFERALSVCSDPNYVPAIIDGLAESLARQQRAERLAEVLRDACVRYGTSYDYLRQGRYLARIHDVDGANLAFRKAARFAPGDPVPYLEMADLYESINDRGRAIEALRRAYLTDPADRRAAERLRGYGIVPGPTIALSPEKEPTVVEIEPTDY